MDDRKHKKILWARISLAAVLIGVGVLGLVIVVVEQVRLDKDSLGKFVPAEPVVVYIHGSEKQYLNNQSDIALDILRLVSPDFLDKWKYLEQSQASEYAYVLLDLEGQLVSGWLVKSSHPTSFVDNFSQWENQTIDKINIYSQSDDFFTALNDTYAGKKKNINKYILQQLHSAPSEFYGFLRPEKFPRLRSVLGDIYIPTAQEGWILEVNNQAWEFTQLVKRPFFSLGLSEYSQKIWPYIFSTEFISISSGQPKVASLLWDYLQWQFPEQIYFLENAMQINIQSLLENLPAKFDLAISPDQDKKSFFWLAKMPYQSNSDKYLDQIFSNYLGFYQPTAQEVSLPDNSKAQELIALPQDFEYQHYPLSQWQIPVVYFSANDYVFKFSIENKLLVGNSFKLLNRYLLKQFPATELPDKCDFTGNSVISLAFGENYIYIIDKSDQIGQKYSICVK